MKSATVTILFAIASVILLTGMVVGYNTMDAKIADLAVENTALTAQVADLQAEAEKVEELTKELDTTKQELETHKEIVARYFEVSTDAGETLEELRDMHTSFAKKKSATTIDEFETSLAELRIIGNTWESLLSDNREAFEEMGIDVDKDITQMKTTLPLVQDSLDEMKAAL